MKFKVIKSKEFTTKSGEKHIHHTVAYKGRVFGLNTLRWEGIELKNESGIINVSEDCELKQITDTDLLTGVTKTFIDIVPKLDLVIAPC